LFPYTTLFRSCRTQRWPASPGHGLHHRAGAPRAGGGDLHPARRPDHHHGERKRGGIRIRADGHRRNRAAYAGGGDAPEVSGRRYRNDAAVIVVAWTVNGTILIKRKRGNRAVDEARIENVCSDL